MADKGPEQQNPQGAGSEHLSEIHRIFHGFDDLVFLIGSDFQIQYANLHGQQYLGRDPIGEKCYESLRCLGEKCPDCMHAKVVAGETQHEEIHYSRQGRWHYVSSIPYGMPDGSVSKLTIFRDITRYKRALAALHSAEEQYRQILVTINEVVFHTDQQGTITFISPIVQEISGYRPIDMRGRSFLDFVHPDDKPRMLEHYQQRLAGNSDPVEFRVIAKDGRALHIRSSSRPIMENGRAVGVAGVMTDCTALKTAEEERRIAEEQLRQSQKMEALGRLAGGVAHDFNNLLFVLLNHAAFALRSLSPSDPVHNNLEQIEKAANRATQLTRQLLDFCRERKADPQLICLRGQVIEMQAMFERILGEDIQVRVEYPDELECVRMDPGHINQILVNLVINARDAMPAGGVLTIECANVDLDATYSRSHLGAEPGAYVMLAVSDTGCGMPPDVRERAFEPFFTTKPVGKGTGLGLSTVYGIVRQNRGFVRIYSEPDVGTTMRIYLPRDTGRTGAECVIPVEPVQGGERVTILVVEDEPSVREIVHDMLKGRGFQVMLAENPSAALELARNAGDDIDVLLTDVIMPVMNGRQLSEHLKESLPELCVVFMSGYTDSALSSHGFSLGADVYLQKPFSERDLMEALRKVVEHTDCGLEGMASGRK